MQSSDARAYLSSAVAATLAPGKRSLLPPQFLLCFLRDPWIGDHHVVATVGEYLKTQVNADSRGHGALLGHRYGNLQIDVPAATVTAEYARANINAIR
jgi:hypothetical protein